MMLGSPNVPGSLLDATSPRAMRVWFAVGGAAAVLLVAASTGCQAVIDFDEARICADEQGVALDCEDPRQVGDIALDCVIGSCNRDTGRCEYEIDEAANGTECDSPNPCLLNTRCQDGVCVGDPAPVDTLCDDNPCNPGRCDADGVCVNMVLQPGDACTPNFPSAQCQQEPATCRAVAGRVPNCIGQPINDFEPCMNLCFTDATNCFNGDCVGNEPVECPEGTVCDPMTGDCVVP